MTRNRVTKLWTAIVTAVLALCTALGLITTTAGSAAARTAPARDSGSAATADTMAWPTASAPWATTRSLPPTMKQRIRAEAHGKSPSCRHRGLADAEPAEHTAASCEPADPAEPAIPLQR
ncbi:DUF6344 domain-containing protein [Streptomyces sp. NPDC051445]|uniref:DUF6344 domain-containing protein n=1 Tax=unclassified Streptomyces TaxID=2593676 RepID=UPI0037B00231